METPAFEIEGVYLDFSNGRGFADMRILYVERTREGTLVCHGGESDGMRVILNHINAPELESMLDMFDGRPWKIA